MNRFLWVLCSTLLVYSYVLGGDVDLRTIRRLTESNLPGTGLSISAAQSSKAHNISAKVQESMKKLRGGSATFYSQLYQAILIIACDQRVKKPGLLGNAPNVQYVPKGDPSAYVDQNGTCIMLNTTDDQAQLASGFCQVAPNCYWADFNATDTVRKTVYADKDGNTNSQDMTLAEAQAFLTTWVKGLVVFVAPGIILAVLTVLTLVFFILCRCCCNKCGGRDPNPNGYNCKKKSLPILFFFLFGVGIAATAAVALVYSHQLTTAVSDSFDLADGMINDTVDWIGNARQPLLNVNHTIFNASTQITVILQGTDFIEYGIDNLTSSLDDFDTNTAKVALPRGCNVTNMNGQICVPCDFCQTVNDQIDSVNNDMKTVSASGLSMLRDTRDILINQIASKSNDTSTAIDTSVRPTYDLQTSLAQARDTVDNIKKTYDANDLYRAYGVLVLFALAAVVLGIGLLGIFFGITPLRCLACILHIAYLVGFIALFISFILAAVLIAISVLLTDVCELAQLLQNDWGAVMGKQAATGINACFQNQSLLDAFNLGSSFDFTNQLKFNNSFDVDSTLNFSQLTSFESQIDNTTTDTFNLSSFGDAELVSALTTITTQTTIPTCQLHDSQYTVNNIMTPWTAFNDPAPAGNNVTDYLYNRYHFYDDKNCLHQNCQGAANDPCPFSAYIIEFWTNISTVHTIRNDSMDFVTGMKTNMTKIINQTNEFKHNVTVLNTNLQQLLNDTVAVVLGDIDDFKASMHCTFVKVDYNKILDKTCTDLIPALTMISLATFLMGIFLIPVNICLIILSKRLSTSKNGEVIIQNDF